VLFNPTTRRRAEIVEATLWDNAPGGAAPLKSRSFAVCGPDGDAIAPQVVNSGSYWGHDFVTLAFPVVVAGLGYARYVIVEEPAVLPAPGAKQIGPALHCWYAVVEHGEEDLENEFLRVALDIETGGIRSLLDKGTSRYLIQARPGTPPLEYAAEIPHAMSAWCVDRIGPAEAPTLSALRRTQAGPHKAAIEVDLRIHESNFTLTFELRAGDPKLYLHLKGVWFQRGTRESGVPTLRFALPLALADAQGSYEIPFGAIRRTLNQGGEVPALQWAQVTGNISSAPAGWPIETTIAS